MMQAALFDMDGVLIDSELHWKRVEKDFLERRLERWTELDHNRIIGLSVDGLHALLAREYGLAMTLPEFRDLYREMADRIYGDQATLLPGAAELNTALRSGGLRTALASSSPREWIDRVLARFPLPFDAVVSADDFGGEGKPSPAIYLRAAAALGAAPARCVALEDSRNGVLAAKRAGMACVGLRNGFNEEQDLSGADLVTRGFAGLDRGRLESLLAPSHAP